MNPDKSISQFLLEFRKEIDKYRKKQEMPEPGSVIFVNELIPGDYIFETNLNLLLDFYESFPDIKSYAEFPKELRKPVDELAIIAHFSLEFKQEIKHREYFISRLVSSYPEMRVPLHWALQLKSSGNIVLVKFLEPHEDFDMLVTTPANVKVEIECKTQSKESGDRIDKGVIVRLASFQKEICNKIGKRTGIVIDCDKDIRLVDAEKLLGRLKMLVLDKLNVDLIEIINEKTFNISFKMTGEIEDITKTEEIEKNKNDYNTQGYQFACFTLFPIDAQTVKGYSFVAVKSLAPKRQLYNLSKGVVEAANYQFTGNKSSLVILHLDVQIDVEKVASNQNFMGLFSNVLGNNPNVSGVIFSSIDLSKPSGEGYSLGRFVPLANKRAIHSIIGIEIPGLLTKDHFK